MRNSVKLNDIKGAVIGADFKNAKLLSQLLNCSENLEALFYYLKTAQDSQRTLAILGFRLNSSHQLCTQFVQPMRWNCLLGERVPENSWTTFRSPFRVSNPSQAKHAFQLKKELWKTSIMC